MGRLSCCKHWELWVHLSCPQSSPGNKWAPPPNFRFSPADLCYSVPHLSLALGHTFLLPVTSLIVPSLLPLKGLDSHFSWPCKHCWLLRIHENQGQQFPRKTWYWVIFGKVDKRTFVFTKFRAFVWDPLPHGNLSRLRGPSRCHLSKWLRRGSSMHLDWWGMVCWIDHSWVICSGGQSSPQLSLFMEEMHFFTHLQGGQPAVQEFICKIIAFHVCIERPTFFLLFTIQSNTSLWGSDSVRISEFAITVILTVASTDGPSSVLWARYKMF